jgi:hypothetical protein
MFGLKSDPVAREWRTLHDEHTHSLCTTANIIRVIKSRWMRWAGRVARMEYIRNAYRTVVFKTRIEDNHLKDLGLDGRIILKRILRK